MALTNTGAPNVWINAATTTWLISFQDADTASLNPGVYRLEVTALINSRTAVLFDGNLEVASAAGAYAPQLPDLITATYCAKQLTEINMTVGQWEALPDLISAASLLFRRWCGDRIFTRMGPNVSTTPITEELDPALNGEVRLSQIPVNQVISVQGNRSTAITIYNISPEVQLANVLFAFSGDYIVGLVPLGLTLNWTSNGTPDTTTIDYTAGMTAVELANLINAVGNGWTALADTVLGSWPVTQLVGGFVSQGAILTQGAQLYCYADQLNDCQLRDGSTGILWVGRQYKGPGPRWGPDWAVWDAPAELGRVLVTYDAGFTLIPFDIQSACAELVKAMLERFKTEAFLASEQISGAGSYSYSLGEGLYQLLPLPVRQTISRYRLNNV